MPASISPAISIAVRSCPCAMRCTLGGSWYSRDMGILGGDPGDALRVHVVVGLQDAAQPDAGGLRIGAHADALADQVLRAAYRRVAPAHQRTVMEAAHQHDRQADDRLGVGVRLGQRGQRDLAQVEVERAHHAAERAGDLRHLLEIEAHAIRRDAAVFQRHRVRVAGNGGAESEQGHGVIRLSLRGAKRSPGLSRGSNLQHGRAPVQELACPGTSPGTASFLAMTLRRENHGALTVG